MARENRSGVYWFGITFIIAIALLYLGENEAHWGLGSETPEARDTK